MRLRFAVTLGLLMGLLTTTYAAAQSGFPGPLRGPILGAASNFSQSWQPGPLSGAAAINLTEFRDEVLWEWIEKDDGSLHFGSRRESYPSMLGARDAGMVFLVYTGHPNWEGGRLPLTPEGRAAFADYTARIVARFPAIHTVEVGNEFNADQFVEDEGWPEDFDERAAAYVALLKATREAVHAVNPDIRFVGGAVHSIPIPWLEALMRQGAGRYMEGLGLHPYTTLPEQLVRQVALLRQVPGLEAMPIEATEFGTLDADQAAGYLLRMYCQMALAGVTRAVWYPFSHRGDGLIPLLEDDGSATEVGRAYAFIAETFEDVLVTDASPDPFTYACQFGDGGLVIWGAPRDVTVMDPEIEVLDATGQPLEGPFRLSRTEPLVLMSDTVPVTLGDTVQLAQQRVIADSFDQFSYDPGAPGFARFIRHRGADIPFQLMGGQQTNGVPWTPYLGWDSDGSVRAGPDWAMPSAWGADDPISILHRYTAPSRQVVALYVEVAPEAQTEDGVKLEVLLNGKRLGGTTKMAAGTLEMDAIALGAGDQLDVILGPNGSAYGDSSLFRARLEARP